MTTITIPKELARRGDLVVIPRKEYDALLKGRRIAPTVDPVIKIYKKEKRQGKLKTIKSLSDIRNARKEVKRGKVISQEKLFKQLGF